MLLFSFIYSEVILMKLGCRFFYSELNVTSRRPLCFFSALDDKKSKKHYEKKHSTYFWKKFIKGDQEKILDKFLEKLMRVMKKNKQKNVAG